MAGGEAAARAGEHVAEGIIAKAAKDVLRDAEGPLARAGEHGGENAATHVGERATLDATRNPITETLQAGVDRARQALLDDPQLAREVLSRGEQEALEREPWLTRIHFGNALERFVARDPALADVLKHVGGAGKPDFEDALKRGYEVTTSNPSTVAAHLLRDYVDPSRLATYDPIPFDFRFDL